MQATELQTRILTLPGGRNLGYTEFGDPHGAPCFYFHFTPGSRLDPMALFSGARQVWLDGIRLIGVDRPGFGRSDPQPGRTLLDWPNDVAALGDHLSLDRFAVLGASGGGGYALTCAHTLPHRLTATLLVSGMGPLAHPNATAGMAPMNRLLYRLSSQAPLLLQVASWALFRAMLWQLRRPTTTSPTKDPTSADATTPPDFMTDPAARPGLTASLAEALRQGTRGLVQDAALYTHPWGFRLEDITAPVHLWHGQHDINTPTSLARSVAASIPDCRATFLHGGHTAPFAHLDEILKVVRHPAPPRDQPRR
jgi:pimeloyl-ACP methyl ester carboxylesterase